MVPSFLSLHSHSNPSFASQALRGLRTSFNMSCSGMVSRTSDGTCKGTARDLNVFADNFDPSSCLSCISSLNSCPVSDESISSHNSKKCTSIRSSNANTPQAPLQATGTNGLASPAAFDPFVTAPTPLSAAGVGTVPANPYSPDSAAVAATAAALNSAAFFANQSGFQQPVSPYFTPFYLKVPNALQVQYHLYAPIGPHSQNTLGYQRNVHDFFLPNDFREELQKKAAATLQMLPSTFDSADRVM